ncbi:MAG: aspartate-semialdehyde dehydrogenase [Phycisphaera sp.]|nr:MAG: aspartate-semialdehyde dehydrogenase [Phycisphaera sp.]
MAEECTSPLAGATIAVVGAYGLVGREALSILADRGVPIERVRVFGSARSAGTVVPYRGGELTITELRDDSLPGCDVALFCTDADTAKAYIPPANDVGVRVVDNSSAYRLDPETPLVVPEVNGELLDDGPMLVANPNCSTILLLLAIEPVRRAFGVRSVIASTYQAISGAGRAALEELFTQTRDVLDGKAAEPSVFPVPCALNVFPHESAVDAETGMNAEEAKIVAESRKILAVPDLDISPTCVRVPVERCHSQSLTIEFERTATLGAVAGVFGAFPGVAFNADPEALITPRDISGSDLISVSRPRLSRNGQRLSLWTCGDQLRKGAALNAVQIAERLAAVAAG